MAMSRDMSVKTVTASTTQSAAGSLTAVANGDITICTVGNASDAVGLPANTPAGTIIYLKGGANAGTLYPPPGGNINAAGVDTSVALAATIMTVAICLTSGSASTWRVDKLVTP